MSRLLSIAAREYGVSEYEGTARSTDYHTVNRGDTLYSLAKLYNTTVDHLMRWNSLKNTNLFAGQQLRVFERDAAISNPRILMYAREAGFTTIKSDDDAWCSIFMNWCALKAGLPMTKTAAARSWLNIGKRVAAIQDADVAVYWRESVNSQWGHVGIPLSFSEDKKLIYTLGGNQSNMVCVKPYEAGRLLAFIKV